MNEFKAYFEAQSALANFLQISFSVITVLGVIWKGAMWFRTKANRPRPASLVSYVASLARGRKVTDLKVLVLDDEPDDYPFGQLRQLGYKVQERTSISLGEIDDLLTFDVILLDIRGVLNEDIKTGGLEILKRLKRRQTSPYVIAVSSKGFDPTVAEFFMLANERLKKPVPAVEIESAISRAYEMAFSAVEAAKRIDVHIGSSNPKNSTARKNVEELVRFLRKETTEERLRDRLEKSLAGDVVRKIFNDLGILQVELT